MGTYRKNIAEYILAGNRHPLPPMAGLAASHHVFEQTVVDAIITAKTIQRPLLIKGEPGLGKSQIAHAIAACMEWNLISLVVHHKTQPTDLLYRVDHLKRLAMAQIMGALGEGLEKRTDKAEESQSSSQSQNKPTGSILSLHKLEEKHFVVPGPLWWAYNAQTASDFYRHSINGYTSAFVDEINVGKPSVLLIDEIDKADRDLPNTLLEVLNNRTFHIPSSDQTVSVQQELAPFVVITSNSERPLPDAFLRRCVVLTLKLSEREEGVRQLMEIADAHYQGSEIITKELQRKAAEVVLGERSQKAEDEYKPGVSEYLDLLSVVAGNDFKTVEQRISALDMAGRFILNK